MIGYRRKLRKNGIDICDSLMIRVGIRMTVRVKFGLGKG